MKIDRIVTEYLELLNEHEIACKKCGTKFDYNSVPEAGMGYIRCPKCNVAMNQEGDMFSEDFEYRRK